MSDKYISADRKNSKKSVFHIDTECNRIKSTVRPVTRGEIRHHGLTLCQYCNPNIDDPRNRGKQDKTYQKALKAAAKENE